MPTTTQAEELAAISNRFKQIGDPDTLEKIYGNLPADSEALAKNPSVIRKGDKFPAFTLTDAHNQPISSSSLLSDKSTNKALLITFYRGSWCPYCNVAIQHLQRHLDEFTKRKVQLVAITPELPDFSLSTVEKQELKFPVLTDRHNNLARQLGIVYDQSTAKDLHDKLGVDLNARNGEATWEVPVPATYLVVRKEKEGKEGMGMVVENAFIEVDFRKRLDPGEAVKWVEEMNENEEAK